MSTATETASIEADRYLQAVAPHLAAIPADERADLLDDLAQHLREIAAEPGPPLTERLGSPEAYAAELLASAGVEGTGPPGPTLLTRATTLTDTWRRSWVGQEVVRTWPFVRPAWWVFRAYLVVQLLSAGEGFPVPRLAGSAVLGLVGVLVAIPLSVRLGERRLVGWARLGVLGANVVLVLYAMSLMGRVDAGAVNYVDYSGGPPEAGPARGCLATAAGDRITNLYAYDAEGRLLDPVLLYDQNGQPVDNLCPEFDERGRRLSTEYRKDANGAPVINAFPRRQAVLERLQPSPPGSPAQPSVTVPVRPPAVVVPRLTPTTTLATPTTTVAPPSG